MNQQAKRLTVNYAMLSKALKSPNKRTLYHQVVEAPFRDNTTAVLLSLGFICLYIVNPKNQDIRLKAVSETEIYRLSVEGIDFNPSKYHLSFDKNKNNTIVRAISSNKPTSTSDWRTLNSGQNTTSTVRLNQASGGIGCTVIYPLTGATKGALMFNYYQYPDEIHKGQHRFMKRYTQIVSRSLDTSANPVHHKIASKTKISV
jgi:hypothetical protein